MGASNSGTLLIYHLGRIEDEVSKGTTWQCRKFEGRFNRVVNLCMYGTAPPISCGVTEYRSAGGRGWRRDLLLAPFRLRRAYIRFRPDIVLTYDMFFAWWVTLLVRCPVLVVPVCLPDHLRELSGTPVSGLPRWLERLLNALSFDRATRVVVPAMMPSFAKWVDGFRAGRRRRVTINPTIVEAFSGPAFLARLNGAQANPQREPAHLLYVGRLHAEKLVLDLIDVLARVAERVPEVRLTMIGDGSLDSELLSRAETNGVRDHLVIEPPRSNEELVDWYDRCTLFVSPYTGMALREAGLCGMAVVAYNVSSAVEFLEDGVNALLVPPGDTSAFASSVVEMLRDPGLRDRLGGELRRTAEDLWGPSRLAQALEETFSGLSG